MTQQEAESKIGAKNLAGHRWHNHDSFNRQVLVELGCTARGTPVWLNRLLTEFDLIVLLGAIEPHLLLGFSGGYKMLVPGCAGAETIGRNHMQGVSHLSYNDVGIRPEDSPMRLDLEEAAQKYGREVFAVNAVLNHDVEIVRFFCGDPVAAQRAGAEFVREHTEVQGPELADVVIANSAPFDVDLRQGMKCVGKTCFAARPGGVILGFVRCDEGRGDVPLPPVSLPYRALRELIHLMGPQRIMSFVNVIKRFDPIEQKFLSHFGLQMLHRNDGFLYSERLEPNTDRRLGLVRQYYQIQPMLADTFSSWRPDTAGVSSETVLKESFSLKREIVQVLPASRSYSPGKGFFETRTPELPAGAHTIEIFTSENAHAQLACEPESTPRALLGVAAVDLLAYGCGRNCVHS